MKTGPAEIPLHLPAPRGWLAAVHHRAPGRKLVILCHGFTGTKVESGRLLVQAARAFARAGLNALRFDFWGSGESSGDFHQMTPNTQIADALAVLAWTRRQRYARVGLLGLSFGGGTVICAAHQAASRFRPDALLTWSSVPSFRWWRTEPPAGEKPGANPLQVGRRFYTDRPRIDIPEAYAALDLPRFQIQGDQDLPEFRERFTAFCPQNDPLVRHLVLPGADHVFTRWEDRRRVLAESTRWLKKQLG